MQALILPTTYEDIRTELERTSGPTVARLTEFVKPIENAEKDLSEIVAQMGNRSGRVVLLLGVPGAGKSTFIESLSWRSHLGFSQLEQIECDEIPHENLMDILLARLRKIAESIPDQPIQPMVVVALNYLENLEGQPEEKVKSFFRNLNGLLRKNRLFIIWPVTSEQDASRMLDHAAAVSGTVFHPGKEIVHFTGPSSDYFEQITKSTVAVLNDGRTIEDVNLTDEDLSELKTQQLADYHQPQTIRRYLERVNERWRERSNYIEQIHSQIPKPTEIWFVVGYPEAEDVVGQFARRSEDVDSAWMAFHSKLWEYIPNSQRAADWNPKRLQLAIGGAFTTRIMYLPTNAMVSSVAAFIDKTKLDLTSEIERERWFKPSAAAEYLSSSPLIRQLRNESSPPGKRKGGPAAVAKDTAEPAFARIVAYATGSGNDRYLNRSLAEAIRLALPGQDYIVTSEQEHPWLPSITPDVRVDTPDGKHICIEFHYTGRREPYVLADYVLKKLDRYMRQLQYYIEHRPSQVKIMI